MSSRHDVGHAYLIIVSGVGTTHAQGVFCVEVTSHSSAFAHQILCASIVRIKDV